MKSVFIEEEKFNRVKYSDSYVVRFVLKGADGYASTFEQRYYTDGKANHHLVEARWKQEYPKATLISIKYE